MPATTRASSTRSTPPTARSSGGQHDRRVLRPRRRHLLDAGGGVRARLRRQHRLPRLQPRRGQRRARLDQVHRRRGLLGPAVADTDSTVPTVYIGSPTTTSTRSTPRTGACAGSRTRRRRPGPARRRVIGDVVYVSVIGPNVGRFGYNVEERQEGLRARARRVQPGDHRRRAPLPHRLPRPSALPPDDGKKNGGKRKATGGKRKRGGKNQGEASRARAAPERRRRGGAPSPPGPCACRSGRSRRRGRRRRRPRDPRPRDARARPRRPRRSPGPSTASATARVSSSS